MPVTVFNAAGIPADHRERIEAAVVAAGKLLAHRFEAWIIPTGRPPGFLVRITGEHGFDQMEEFNGDESDAEIIERVRQMLASGS